MLAGCHSPPRAQVAPEREIALATGVPELVQFRVVRADGVPVDEPAVVEGALTLADAVRRALRTDPRLQSALARVRIAVAQADQARLLPNPVLGVVLRAGSGKPQIEASLVQEFVRALQRPTRASAADHRLREMAAEAVATALDVLGEVQERYIAAQTSTALLPLLEERYALVERLVATAKARLDVGEGTRADVVTLDAQRVELQVSIDRSTLDVRTRRLRLARLIGEPSSAAEWTLDTWSPNFLASQPEEVWTAAALTSRPEIQAVVWRLAALGDDAALAAWRPWDEGGVGVDAQHASGWQLGPTLSTPLPLFDNGQAQRATVSAEQLEARHQLTLAQRRVVEEVRTAYRELAASAAILARIRDELIPLQAQRRQLAEDAYRAGLTDVTPLFLSEQDLRVAQTQAIEGEAQTAIALVRLQRAVGGPGVAAELDRPQSSAPESDAAPLAVDRTPRSSLERP